MTVPPAACSLTSLSPAGQPRSPCSSSRPSSSSSSLSFTLSIKKEEERRTCSPPTPEKERVVGCSSGNSESEASLSLAPSSTRREDEVLHHQNVQQLEQEREEKRDRATILTSLSLSSPPLSPPSTVFATPKKPGKSQSPIPLEKKHLSLSSSLSLSPLLTSSISSSPQDGNRSHVSLSASLSPSQERREVGVVPPDSKSSPSSSLFSSAKRVSFSSSSSLLSPLKKKAQKEEEERHSPSPPLRPLVLGKRSLSRYGYRRLLSSSQVSLSTAGDNDSLSSSSVSSSSLSLSRSSSSSSPPQSPNKKKERETHLRRWDIRHHDLPPFPAITPASPLSSPPSSSSSSLSLSSPSSSSPDLVSLFSSKRERGVEEGVRTRVVFQYNDRVTFSRVISEDSLQFDSHFEGGNLQAAHRVYGETHGLWDQEYDLYPFPDTHTSGYIQWFFFSLSCTKAGTVYRLNILNMAKPFSLFSSGMRPLSYSSLSNHNNQQEKKRGTKVTSSSSLLSHSVSPSSKSPLTGTNLRKERGREGEMGGAGGGESWKREGSSVCYYETERKGKRVNCLSLLYTARHTADRVYFAYCFPYSYSGLDAFLRTRLKPREEFYVRREALAYTLAGNRVDLITITAKAKSQEDLLSRPYVIFSARVHPGESNGSYIMHGIINFLTSLHPEAVELREKFVFKLVPMLNPDGVVAGNYRTSLAGVDLNRRWQCPDPALHPEIFYFKSMIKKLQDTRRIYLFCDLHGHSRRRNVFIYGCADKPNQLQNLPVQKSKEGTARVVLWRELKVERSYTLEASFQGGGDGGHFSVKDLENIGANLCGTLLDLERDREREKTFDLSLLLSSSSSSTQNRELRKGREGERGRKNEEEEDEGSDSDPSGDEMERENLDRAIVEAHLQLPSTFLKELAEKVKRERESKKKKKRKMGKSGDVKSLSPGSALLSPPMAAAEETVSSEIRRKMTEEQLLSLSHAKLRKNLRAVMAAVMVAGRGKKVQKLRHKAEEKARPSRASLSPSLPSRPASKSLSLSAHRVNVKKENKAKARVKSSPGLAKRVKQQVGRREEEEKRERPAAEREERRKSTTGRPVASREKVPALRRVNNQNLFLSSALLSPAAEPSSSARKLGGREEEDEEEGEDEEEERERKPYEGQGYGKVPFSLRSCPRLNLGALHPNSSLSSGKTEYVHFVNAAALSERKNGPVSPQKTEREKIQTSRVERERSPRQSTERNGEPEKERTSKDVKTVGSSPMSDPLCQKKEEKEEKSHISLSVSRLSLSSLVPLTEGQVASLSAALTARTSSVSSTRLSPSTLMVQQE